MPAHAPNKKTVLCFTRREQKQINIKDCISRFSYMKGGISFFFKSNRVYWYVVCLFKSINLGQRYGEILSLSIQFKFIFYVDWHTCRLVLSTNLMKRGWNRPKEKNNRQFVCWVRSFPLQILVEREANCSKAEETNSTVLTSIFKIWSVDQPLPSL